MSVKGESDNVVGRVLERVLKIIFWPLIILLKACSPFSGSVDEEKSDNYYYSKDNKHIHYSPMGNWFELGNTRIEEADVESFNVLGREFARDKNHVYYEEHIIDDEVDKESFEVVDHEYGPFYRDKQNVYVRKGHWPVDGQKNDGKHLLLVPNADPGTYEELEDYRFARDSRSYFYRNKPVEVDPESFEILNEFFARDGQGVYLLSRRTLLDTKIDPTEVKVLNKQYIVDDQFIYDYQEYEDGNVIDSLVQIPFDNYESIRFPGGEYLCTSQKVYHYSKEIEGVVAKDFVMIDEGSYAHDQKRVYFHGSPIADADIETFELMPYGIYSRDKNHVYFRGEVMAEADAQTFRPADDEGFRYKDKNHTYLGGEIVK